MCLVGGHHELTVFSTYTVLNQVFVYNNFIVVFIIGHGDQVGNRRMVEYPLVQDYLQFSVLLMIRYEYVTSHTRTLCVLVKGLN